MSVIKALSAISMLVHEHHMHACKLKAAAGLTFPSLSERQVYELGKHGS